ncbi:MAG: hypothetical protein FJY97_14060 [candidate division Zixibacteria bacterium]|nr:hypothetical protein [candidate division Zixibacteria bacterium]
MTTDQFLIVMGTVKTTIETFHCSQDRIVQAMNDQIRGRSTPTQTQQTVQAERDRQESQVSAAVEGFLSRNAQVGKAAFGVPPGEMSDEMLNVIEYLQTKFPGLFRRYMD